MIHNDILETLKATLNRELRLNVDPYDPARVGLVQLGPLQGDPDPDEARIFITLHENDPDAFISGAVSSLKGEWGDEIEEIEIGGSVTWKRRFTAKARCLLDSTAEDLVHARQIASTVRDRIETSLLHTSFAGFTGEYVSRPIISSSLQGEMIQAGGPDSYDFFIKVRFDVLTTRS